MIEELQIRGLGVIEDAILELSPGLTVVTGETGAGKTMLVTALQLLLGARADPSLVRRGEQDAWVAARVSPVPPAAADWSDGPELVVERELRAEGRSRARIEGRLAPVGALAEVLGDHVEVHGQGEHARLARPTEQRALLDRYAGTDHADALATHERAVQEWRDAEDRLARLEDDARERQRTIDRLRHELGEIERVGPDPAVDGDLDERLGVLEHAEELALAAERAALALSTEGVGGPLGEATDALRRLPAVDPVLEEAGGRVVALAEEARDLASMLRLRAEQLGADPDELDRLRSRQRSLAALFRRYGADVHAVLAHAEAAAKELVALEMEEADAGTVAARVSRCAARATATAAEVTTGRVAAARALEEAVDGLLAALGMPHATFTVELTPTEVTAVGAERVAFMLAANPGEPAASLQRAASGGERSRVALAVEVALADVEGAGVLVFDEVDAGIGGATAMAVGEQLRALAHTGRSRQVLCVTHLAQLAAFADVHHRVTKDVVDGRTTTSVVRVTEDQRDAELARMLGGDPDDPAGIAHARTLLDRAGAV